MNAQKAKGSKAERQVADYLFGHGIVAERIPAGATADRGDLWLPGPTMPTVDVKDHARMELGEWLDRAAKQCVHAHKPFGAVWHKRRGKGSPADWYVSVAGSSFVQILKRLEAA